MCFWDRQAGLTEVDIRIPTGGTARAERLRLACQDFALTHGCALWVMPNLWPTPIPGRPWLVFKLEVGRCYLLVEHMPTVAAAEMWMIHHGPNL